MPGHRKNMKKVPKKITKKPTQKPTQKLSAFGKAFFEARRDKGPNSTFPFKGKQYSTVTADQVKAAGFKTLREYLNSRNPKPINVLNRIRIFPGAQTSLNRFCSNLLTTARTVRLNN